MTKSTEGRCDFLVASRAVSYQDTFAFGVAPHSVAYSDNADAPFFHNSYPRLAIAPVKTTSQTSSLLRSRRIDIKSISSGDAKVVSKLAPAFERYNEEQFTTVKLPGGSQKVIVSAHNSLGDGRYYDVESSSSFAFDHTTQKASAVQSYALESAHSDLVNGRWRSLYTLDPASGAIDGSIKVDVHYYEDGNVRLLTDKATTATVPSATGSAIVKEIGSSEKKYQEELNRGFTDLSEGAFKGLRRQLPVTRQKIEWDKVASYRLGQDIGGGRRQG
ncbi:F-actin-capping protein subunit alpha [Pyricularia oryzae 70-15]|uniref:F-actin-capping protein subunit alpha n=1 Tax=Pyricularia oryzae (strain 70-15 / ATCC MYA-4617 / FGSC 8958) TaxID=242507 RepID=G4N6W5_PYRO7|nr:F-actin-capping protein subunit alpha [Pyricularia oryzae 70-15]EHA50729.1 F-actin-capping protein subunit alpha [Pyricularia oryzae 70-15]